MPADECNSRREKYELEVKYSKDKELIWVEEKGIWGICRDGLNKPLMAWTKDLRAKEACIIVL